MKDSKISLKTLDEAVLKSTNPTLLKEDEIIPQTVTIWQVIQNLIPNISSSAITIFITTAEVHFIGQTKDNKLYDGIGLAQVYINVLIYYIGSGFCESLIIFCPKNFGSGNFKLLGIQTNQIRIIVTLYYLFFILITSIFCEHIITLLVGEISYLQITKTYILITMPAYFMSLQYDIYCKHSESQLVYKPVIISLVLSIMIHPTICYYLINHYGMGVIGAGIASNVTETIKLLTMIIYFTTINPYSESNFFFNKETFINFWKIVKISTISAFIFFSEYIGYSISSIFAAKLGDLAYAKHLNLSCINSLNYMINYGFLNSTSIIIGNYVGQNSPTNIKKSIKYLIIIAFLIEIPLISIFIFFQKRFIIFFSENYLVSNADMNDLIILMSIYGALDLFQAILQGILRGLGLIKTVSFYSITLFLVVQPSLYYMFIYWANLELEGLWAALVICLIVLNSIYLALLLFRVDINKICRDFKNNLNKDIVDVVKYEEEEYSVKINCISRSDL